MAGHRLVAWWVGRLRRDKSLKIVQPLLGLVFTVVGIRFVITPPPPGDDHMLGWFFLVVGVLNLTEGAVAIYLQRRPRE